MLSQEVVDKLEVLENTTSIEKIKAILITVPGNYYAWNKFLTLIEAQNPSLSELRQFSNLVLEKGAKCYQAWNFRRILYSNCTDSALKHKVLQEELNYVEDYISKDLKNMHAWDFYGFLLAEKSILKQYAVDSFFFCIDLLRIDAANSSVYNHICWLLKESKDQVLLYVKEFIVGLSQSKVANTFLSESTLSFLVCVLKHMLSLEVTGEEEQNTLQEIKAGVFSFVEYVS